MKIKFTLIFSLLILSLAFTASNPFESLFPKHFPAPAYTFTHNPLSAEKIQLGRTLFYDPILSKDLTISCASCHSPYNAFAHTDHDLSHGIHDQIGMRNAPALFNLAWQTSFMWDGGINHLDMQALAPIGHPAEMGENIASVVEKLQHSTLYPGLFSQAFQDSVITGEHLLKALSLFQLTLVSSNAKYDSVKTGAAFFTNQEKNGYDLFLKNCNSCHTEPLFSTYKLANNGLALDTTLNDYGKGTITQNSSDSLFFKIPSLRNLSYTYPYMHDGRFSKLRQVLIHYTERIVPHKNLSKELQTPIVLSSNEKVDLIAFLLTLDDKIFVFNPENKFPREILK